jgi:hypothetical protein
MTGLGTLAGSPMTRRTMLELSCGESGTGQILLSPRV